ncbi:MAG: Spo0B domain-containing protein [Oscillospiraceae bacterium]|jgi:sensor histidine kinase regulating citrate/malate metabolism|nr:Spo0B domain-containing protein [Oscillospiraceae bacterium]
MQQARRIKRSLRPPAAGRNVRKLAAYAVIINAVQIVTAVLLMCMWPTGGRGDIDAALLRAIATAFAALVCAGALVDIREAARSLRARRQAQDMAQTYAQLEDLNRTMRAQRHDFLNHMQVIYSLLEMGEHAEARDYIERVHGDMRRVSRAMRTDSPAVNALLQAKLGDCEKRGIAVDLAVHAPWKGLPVPGWEMCRILANLIDNAMDALHGQDAPALTIAIFEDERAFRFRVENNGPPIPEDVAHRMFQPGFTTKPQGQGMGLHIVRGVLAEHGGDISVTSAPGRTAFEGLIPRQAGGGR